MVKVLKESLSGFFKAFFTNWIEDFLILLGVAVILATTYLTFGYTVGNYALGIILLLFGFIVAKK